MDATVLVMGKAKVTSFRAYRDNPEAEKAFAGYRPSLEDLLAIQEWREECAQVAAGIRQEVAIAETHTIAARPSALAA